MKLLAFIDAVEPFLYGESLAGYASGVEAVGSCGDPPFEHLRTELDLYAWIQPPRAARPRVARRVRLPHDRKGRHPSREPPSFPDPVNIYG